MFLTREITRGTIPWREQVRDHSCFLERERDREFLKYRENRIETLLKPSTLCFCNDQRLNSSKLVLMVSLILFVTLPLNTFSFTFSLPLILSLSYSVGRGDLDHGDECRELSRSSTGTDRSGSTAIGREREFVWADERSVQRRGGRKTSCFRTEGVNATSGHLNFFISYMMEGTVTESLRRSGLICFKISTNRV